MRWLRASSSRRCWTGPDNAAWDRLGTEWEFRVQAPGEIRRPLVPDVAYVSYSRLPYDAGDEADIPRIAPDAVVELLSPDDTAADVEEKVRVYLAAGTAVVFLVDTKSKTVTARRRGGSTIFKESDELREPASPGFSMPVRLLFEQPRPRQAQPGN